ERSTALIATLLFCLTPRAFNWEIVGGGLTRSPGLLFAVLALWQGYQMYRTPARRYVVSTALLAGVSLLFHLEMGFFVAYSMAFFFLAFGRSRRALADSVLVGVIVAVATAPWWASV